MNMNADNGDPESRSSDDETRGEEESAIGAEFVRSVTFLVEQTIDLQR
jgi:hypothetical protein